jgi:glutathione S-transferase
MNPNGRIPVLVDHTRDDFAIFESAAIMLYLEQYYDKENILSFDPATNPKEYSSMIQWALFSVNITILP